mgnify:CR=1 FL=1
MDGHKPFLAGGRRDGVTTRTVWLALIISTAPIVNYLVALATRRENAAPRRLLAILLGHALLGTIAVTGARFVLHEDVTVEGGIAAVAMSGAMLAVVVSLAGGGSLAIGPILKLVVAAVVFQLTNFITHQ